MTVKFQRRIYDAARIGRNIIHGKYEYTIDYHHMAVTHTWIIRRLANCPWHDWEWLQPLDTNIR